MAKLPSGVGHDEITIVSRRILLDALEALDSQRHAVVLVGAQAVYQHTESAELGVAAYTSDGDLGLDPALVSDDPLIQLAMQTAGFARERPNEQAQPGAWWKRQRINGEDIAIQVDLLVPSELAEGSAKRRSVAVGPHDRNALRRVLGLGVAMEDNATHHIVSLESDQDDRAIDIQVAGVAALLVAKAFKLGERLAESPDRPDRLVNKDASDVLGLMFASDPDEVAETFQRLLKIERIAETTSQGLRYLDQLFSTPPSPGINMAIEALVGVKDETLIRQLAPAYIQALPSA